MTHVILGSSQVGERTVLGDNVIVGHPAKESVAKHRNLSESSGATIGADCIIRSGSVIYEKSVLGNALQLAHNVVIREFCQIGDGCAFGNGVVIREYARLGRNVRLMECVVISEGAQIGNDVFVGPNVSFTAGRYMTGALEASGKLQHTEAVAMEGSYWEGPSVIVEDEVRIGANAVILAGVRLGHGCIVASGAVVSASVPAGATAVGNPARILKVATA